VGINATGVAGAADDAFKGPAVQSEFDFGSEV
jgi:hypothetical protein